MGTYRIMMITSQARRVHSRRATQRDELREVIRQPLSVLAQMLVAMLLSLSLAATYSAKVIFNTGGSIHPLAIALALGSLVAAGLLAGGGWRVPSMVGEPCTGDLGIPGRPRRRRSAGERP